ncbi:MAG UNVERIFIED_CONTAM: HNH endonuclease [Thermobifida fusca]
MKQLNAIFGGKWCPDCEQHLPRECFHRNTARADGLHQCCKTCESARNAAYSRTPAGRASAKGRNHRRRARERSLPTDGTGPRDWAAWAEEQDDFRCHLCGGDLTEDDEIHWDHIDPISTGTTGTVLHNMHAAHARCNLMRGNRSLEEWWAATGLLDFID